MGKKKLNKVFQAIAYSMPLVFTNTTETHFVTGKQLIEQGTFDVDGVKIDPEKKYLQRMPVQLARNHERRIKEACKRGGANGIQQYLKQVNSIVENNIIQS